MTSDPHVLAEPDDEGFDKRSFELGKEYERERFAVRVNEEANLLLDERLAAAAARLAAQAEEIGSWRRVAERCKQEAEQWAMEARAHKSSLHEAYQAITGATGEPGNWNGARPIIEAFKRLQAERDGVVAALREAPRIPDIYRWTGTGRGLEDMFDLELRHASGKTPVDYLNGWLGMLRPFAFATKDDSWGEMEKLLCIVMRNYVRMADSIERALTASSDSAGEP